MARTRGHSLTHLSFADALNLIPTLTLIGALVFTGLQVRSANSARCDQAAVKIIQTALSENSARVLELFGEIPEGAAASAIDALDATTQRETIQFGLRLEVMGYMVFHRLLDLQIANDLAGGTILGYWSRAKACTEARRQRTGHDEFLEWCEWLVTRVTHCRAQKTYVPAYRQSAD